MFLEQARLASRQQPATPLASAMVGDARQLDCPDAQRRQPLPPAGRPHHPINRGVDLIEASTLRRGGRCALSGVLAAAAISRFASTCDGLLRGYLDEPGFETIVERDVREG